MEKDHAQTTESHIQERIHGLSLSIKGVFRMKPVRRAVDGYHIGKIAVEDEVWYLVYKELCNKVPRQFTNLFWAIDNNL